MYQEREKKREEKRIEMERLKEWSRPRDDMECDDLKVCMISCLLVAFLASQTCSPLELNRISFMFEVTTLIQITFLMCIWILF